MGPTQLPAPRTQAVVGAQPTRGDQTGEGRAQQRPQFVLAAPILDHKEGGDRRDGEPEPRLAAALAPTGLIGVRVVSLGDRLLDHGVGRGAPAAPHWLATRGAASAGHPTRQPGCYSAREALRRGAEVVGGLDPAGIDRDPAGQLDAIFTLAERYGVEVDIHLHDPGELGAFQVELIAERTRALAMQGRVAISHAFCLGQVEELRYKALEALLVEFDIAIMTHIAQCHKDYA
jgi:hypothetical protein